MVRGVAIVATRTGVHAGHEHEVAGVGDAVFCPADVDLVVLQRLAQHFQGVLVELGQLVAEQHTVVGHADLARHGVDTAAHESHL